MSKMTARAILIIQHKNSKQKHLHSFPSNNKHLFTNIAAAKETNQGCRAILKALSYVFHI